MEEVNLHLRNISKECKSRNIWKVLLDTSSLNNLNISRYKQFEYGEIIAMTLNDNVKLAVFGEGELFTQFTSDVATKRGINTKVSHDFELLKSWLIRN